MAQGPIYLSVLKKVSVGIGKIRNLELNHREAPHEVNQPWDRRIERRFLSEKLARESGRFLYPMRVGHAYPSLLDADGEMIAVAASCTTGSTGRLWPVAAQQLSPDVIYDVQRFIPGPGPTHELVNINVVLVGVDL